MKNPTHVIGYLGGYHCMHCGASFWPSAEALRDRIAQMVEWAEQHADCIAPDPLVPHPLLANVQVHGDVTEPEWPTDHA